MAKKAGGCTLDASVRPLFTLKECDTIAFWPKDIDTDTSTVMDRTLEG